MSSELRSSVLPSSTHEYSKSLSAQRCWLNKLFTCAHELSPFLTLVPVTRVASKKLISLL